MGQEAGAGPLHLKHDYMAKSVLNGKKWKDGAIHAVKGGGGTKRACLATLFSHPEEWQAPCCCRSATLWTQVGTQGKVAMI